MESSTTTSIIFNYVKNYRHKKFTHPKNHKNNPQKRLLQIHINKHLCMQSRKLWKFHEGRKHSENINACQNKNHDLWKA